MIYSLIRFHSIEPIALYSAIAPEYVPVFFVGIRQLYVVNLGNAPDNWIMTMIHIYVESPICLVLLSLLLFHATLVLILDYLLQIIGLMGVKW